MLDYNTTAIDLAKETFHVVTVDKTGKQTAKKKVKRNALLPYIASLDKNNIIAMEACSGSNYWAQEIKKLGFTVKLMKTKDVKIYAKSRQKNDYNDALAICKAARDTELRTVRAKNKEEQDVSLMHKIRKNTLKERIRKTNSMISTLHEYGYITKLGKKLFSRNCNIEVKLAYQNKVISGQTYKLLIMDCKEIQILLKKEKAIEATILELNKSSPRAKKLIKINGIGQINASYLSIAPMEEYDTPRDFAASLGIVPKQFTSGDKEKLGRITKQGDRYARTMLIHGGRAVTLRAKIVKNPTDKLTLWAQKKLLEKKPFNVVAVGVANKLARIAYSIIINDAEYKAS